MSKPEILLWKRLKQLRAQGFHFRRQAPFRGYFLDFVCFPRRVVVEVDGGQHGQDLQAEHDLVRDRILRRGGFTVLRFWTREVWLDLDGVVDRIVLALNRAASTRNPSSSSVELDPHFPTLAASRPVPPH